MLDVSIVNETSPEANWNRQTCRQQANLCVGRQNGVYDTFGCPEHHFDDSWQPPSAQDSGAPLMVDIMQYSRHRRVGVLKAD